jgi:hypothetical protein
LYSTQGIGLHDGKAWATHSALLPQCAQQASDPSGFTRAQSAGQEDDQSRRSRMRDALDLRSHTFGQGLGGGFVRKIKMMG